MIRKIVFQFDNQDGRISDAMGYRLYGCLSELMDTDYAEFLHNSVPNPVCQYVSINRREGKAYWNISLLGEEACRELAFLSIADQFNLRAEGITLKAIGRTEETIASPVELLDRAASTTGSRLSRISFETPCSFKTNNEYAIFPDCGLIARSIMQKWNAYAPSFPVDDPDAERMLIGGLRIVRYSLKSRRYFLKEAKIPSFSGSLTISHRLSSAMEEIWRLLLLFSNYCGIGIKAALGMGGVKVCDETREGTP